MDRTRGSVKEFFKLSNGQWLKILFSCSKNIWNMSIVVSKTKRQCNDCFNKTENSPKILYGRCTGNNLGVEAFIISLKVLLKFEKHIQNTQINIMGASDRLNNIYKHYLKRYGYNEYKYIKFGKPSFLMYKKII